MLLLGIFYCGVHMFSTKALKSMSGYPGTNTNAHEILVVPPVLAATDMIAARTTPLMPATDFDSDDSGWELDSPGGKHSRKIKPRKRARPLDILVRMDALADSEPISPSQHATE